MEACGILRFPIRAVVCRRAFLLIPSIHAMFVQTYSVVMDPYAVSAQGVFLYVGGAFWPGVRLPRGIRSVISLHVVMHGRKLV